MIVFVDTLYCKYNPPALRTGGLYLYSTVDQILHMKCVIVHICKVF